MKRFARISCWLVVAGWWCMAHGTQADTEALPRNPFWPVGYDGKRYPISAEPRFKLNRQRTADGVSVSRSGEDDGAGSVMGLGDVLTNDPIWTDAAATLRFGSTLAYSDKNRSQAAIAINERIYAVGDLVSINFKGHRLTWRVESLSSEGKITLKRLTYRKLGLNPQL